MQCAAPMVSFMSVHASDAVIIDYLINIHKPSDLTASKLVAPALTLNVIKKVVYKNLHTFMRESGDPRFEKP